MSEIAETPKPPYYAVIFSSVRTEGGNGYAEMSQKMFELAREQKGFLGVESAREGLGITISYWETPEDIANWKRNEEHLIAQQKGAEVWYQSYKTRICLVERDYGFEKNL
jgi:heme-degrading monooxygenase HmoA